MLQSSHWRGPQRREREKDERDTTEVLIPFNVPQKAKDMANLQLNVGTAGNMAISHLSAAATGTDDMDGIPMDPIQAVREDSQASWQNQRWGRGQQARGWAAGDWGRSTASGSAAPPPEPANPPRLTPRADASSAAAPMPDSGATGSTESTQQVPMRPPIISEEYCEINGQPHFKRTLADGTVEYESW